MGLGDAWTDTTAASVSKLNTSTIIYGTGTYLQTLDKTKHKVVVCTATSGGLAVDHVYCANNAGDTWVDMTSMAPHNHTSSADGGDIGSIFQANPTWFDLALTKTQDLKKAQWIEAITSTGVISDDTDGTTGERSIKLDSGATSGASAQISYPHLQLDFSKRALFEAKIRIGTASSLAFHIGVGADDITAADSNTRKIQCELCTVTNNNFWLRTATGSANSSSDTGVAFGTSRTPIEIRHFPAEAKTELYVGSGSSLVKTTNIPVDSTTADNNLVKFSLKNSTAASRTMFCYGARLAYYVSDEWI